MPKRIKNNEYYAVIRGFYISVPTIFSSWGDAHAVVTGFSDSGIRAFESLANAEDYMDNNGVTFYKYDIKYGAGKTTPIKGQKAYYAVANGRTPGIKEYYYGNGGTEPETAMFSCACHKHFRTEAQAKSFISDWIEMFVRVAQANIKKALLDGHRSAHMQIWSLQFEWKKDTDGDEHKLTDGMKGIKLEDSE